MKDETFQDELGSTVSSFYHDTFLFYQMDFLHPWLCTSSKKSSLTRIQKEVYCNTILVSSPQQKISFCFSLFTNYFYVSLIDPSLQSNQNTYLKLIWVAKAIMISWYEENWSKLKFPTADDKVLHYSSFTFSFPLSSSKLTLSSVISEEYPETFSRQKGIDEFSPQEAYACLLLKNTVENKSLKTKYSNFPCISQAREFLKHNSYHAKLSYIATWLFVVWLRAVANSHILILKSEV